MALHSIISILGVLLFFAGLTSSVIVSIFYLNKASSPQWSDLTGWEKYVYPMIMLLMTTIILDIGIIIGLAYGNNSQVAYRNLVSAFKVGTGFSGCLWLGFVYAYYIGVWVARVRASGSNFRIGIKRRK